MNILTELKKELGYANVTNQYIELATRTFQMDHGKESLQERARLVGLCVSEIPEDYTTRIAKGYITGVHSCVEHFLFEYRMLTGSPANGHEYKADDDEKTTDLSNEKLKEMNKKLPAWSLEPPFSFFK